MWMIDILVRELKSEGVEREQEETRQLRRVGVKIRREGR